MVLGITYEINQKYIWAYIADLKKMLSKMGLKRKNVVLQGAEILSATSAQILFWIFSSKNYAFPPY